MIDQIKESKMIKQDVVISEVCRCDICNNMIYKKKENANNGAHLINYFYLTTGHYDWGNDSIESMQNYDICSAECLHKALDKFLRDFIDSNTAYFEVSKRARWAMVKEEE